MADIDNIALNDDEIIDDISGRTIGKEMNIIGIAAREEVSSLLDQVAAANPLRPVRSTLVAPILPEPMLRRSPAPISLVNSSPKGTEPRKYPKPRAKAII